jgi:(S)-ureidoglycine aminohydrolase
VKVLASPALGSAFVEYLIELHAGKTGTFAADAKIETFVFVLTGTGRALDHNLIPGGFGLIPPGVKIEVTANETLTLLILRKRYESAAGIEMFKPLFGQEMHVKKEVWGDNPHSLLQTLIPDDFAYDMAMNIFTFDPGFGLPIVETHVMEHGLYFLQGKGLYYLQDRWMEVEANDFIWMGPYCPQSFCATGPTPSRYIYYKNVNRDIST